MKNLLIGFITLLPVQYVNAQNVGIGTTTPAPSAQLEVKSSTKGFLPPRMTFAQRNAIINPVEGLVIYCTDCYELQVFNGVIWKNMLGGVTSSPIGFPTVDICDQVWMGRNLSVSTYSNGDIIPQVTDPTVWSGLAIGAWCWYNNDSATYSKYGKLYNGYAVHDARGLAPIGWHIPVSINDLISCLGGLYEIAGGKMKETGTTHWLTPNTGATNSSGFTGLPGGYRNPLNGQFMHLGNFGDWWIKYENPMYGGFYYNLSSETSSIATGAIELQAGFSVRCVKD